MNCRLFLVCAILLFCGCDNATDHKALSKPLLKITLAEQFVAGDRASANNQEVVVIKQEDDLIFVQDQDRKTLQFPSKELQKVYPYFDFRGSQPGVPLNWALKVEPSQPIFQDSLGLSFSYSLDNGRYFQIDYFATQKEGKQIIQSMVLEAFISDEADAILMYKEFASWLTQRHGAPNGQLGDFSWTIPDKGFLHSLQLTAGRKNILYMLSFSDPNL